MLTRVVVVSLALGIAVPAAGAVLCAKQKADGTLSGNVVVREVCKPKEVRLGIRALDPAVVGPASSPTTTSTSTTGSTQVGMTTTSTSSPGQTTTTAPGTAPDCGPQCNVTKSDGTLCDIPPASACNGACPEGTACVPWSADIIQVAPVQIIIVGSGCKCIPTGASCGPEYADFAACTIGPCPSGQVCEAARYSGAFGNGTDCDAALCTPQ